MMNRQFHERVKDIFLAACELDDSQRVEFLDTECGGNAELRQEVVSLLRYHFPDTLISGLSDTNVEAARFQPAYLPEEWVGRSVGRYDITRFLDSGGMGIVLEAKDRDIGRRVAIKVLRTELSGDDPSRQRFLAEAQAAGNLNHPNVVTIYEVANDGENHFIAMEFADGGSAADQLKKAGPYTVKEAVELLEQACRGVGAAHSKGLVHRDLKPANLLLTAERVVKVSDFGIAKILTGDALQLTYAGQLVGTPSYMSPEQCEGKPVDARSDIYSLGATFFSLLVGKAPYEEQKSLVSVINAHCNADPPDPRDYDTMIPEGCAAIISRAMAKDPADRYQSAEEMLTALENYERLNLDSSSHIQKLATESKGKALLAGMLVLIVGAWGIFFAANRDMEESSRAGVPAVAEQQPIRVGILHSLSGTMALTEAAMVEACLLAVEELNAQGGVAGRKVEAILEDGQSNEFAFAAAAKRLIEEEKVCTIFGCCTSASRKAVKKVVEQANHLLVYATNTEGVETSPNIVYLGGEPTQTIIPCVRWAYGLGEKRTFFLVGSDYIYPRVANEIVKDQLKSLGATLVGEEYIELGSTRVQSVVDKIVDARPDAIINTISGDVQAAFSRELRSRGISVTQFTTGVGEQELRNADISKLIDDYSVGTYFQSIETLENREFIERFKARYGIQRVINAAAESSYAGVMLWAKAVDQVGETEPTAILKAMCAQEIVAPSGPIRIDPTTHYAYRRSYLGMVQPNGQFSLVWQSPSLEAPAPFPSTRTIEQWGKLLEHYYELWGERWSAPPALETLPAKPGDSESSPVESGSSPSGSSDGLKNYLIHRFVPSISLAISSN